MAAQTQIPSDARFDAPKNAVVDGQGNVIEGLEHIKDEQTFNDEKAKQAETVE